MASTLRFLRNLLRPETGAVAVEETTYRRAGEALPASLYRPVGRAGGADASLPGWVALHGLTYRGRHHESLDRFARALAAAGAAVLVPDIPEWRALNVAPATTVETIKAAVLELDGRPFVAPGRVGVIGFSFGGTQALVAATDPALEGHLAAVASWGGYAELRRAIRFGCLGDHELDGVSYHLDPDPYGRWIFAGNYLPYVPEYRQDRPLADALLGLAREVGRRKIMAWDPATDPLKETARAGLDGRRQELFDLIAPPTGTSHTAAQRDRIGVLADRLASGAAARDPLLDPAPYLPEVPVPVFLAHGREDRLLPWTELVRLRRALPRGRLEHAVITPLFAHSFREKRVPTPSTVLEALRFVRAINRMVHLI
jgi:dienelactone hydrolase